MGRPAIRVWDEADCERVHEATVRVLTECGVEVTMLTKESVWNSSHWANAEFDSLFKQYSATVDEGSRSDIATKMGTIQQDETPVILAFWMDSLRATTKRVHNVQGLEAYLDLTNAYVTG